MKNLLLLLLSVVVCVLVIDVLEHDTKIQELDARIAAFHIQQDSETQRLKLAIKAINDNQQIRLHQVPEN